MLSEKNKQRFDEWLKDKPYYKHYTIEMMIIEFYDLPPEMQKGVYEKYFNSLKIIIDIRLIEHKVLIWDYRLGEPEKAMVIYIDEDVEVSDISYFTEAVKQLDKLINDELNK